MEGCERRQLQPLLTPRERPACSCVSDIGMGWVAMCAVTVPCRAYKSNDGSSGKRRVESKANWCCCIHRFCLNENDQPESRTIDDS